MVAVAATNRTVNGRVLSAAAIFIDLEAELDGLARLNCAVPSEVGRRVRIAAAEVCVPGTGHAVGIILPAHIPAIDRGAAIIGNANGGSVTTVPFVTNDMATHGGLGRVAVTRCSDTNAERGHCQA